MESQSSAQCQLANQSLHQGGNPRQGNHQQARRYTNNGRNRGGHNTHSSPHGHKDSQYSGYNNGYNNRGNNSFFNKRGGGKLNGGLRSDGAIFGSSDQGPAIVMGPQNMQHLPGVTVYGNCVPSQPIPPAMHSTQLNPGVAPYMMSSPNAMSQILVPGPYTMMPPNIPHLPIVGGYNSLPQMARQIPAHPAYGPPPPVNQGLPIPITPRHEAALLDSYQGFDKFMESKADSASKTVPNTPNFQFPPYHFGTTLSPNSMAAMSQRGPKYHPSHGIQPPHTAMPSFEAPDGVPADADTNVKLSSVSSIPSSRPKIIETPLANSHAQHDQDICAIAALPEHECMALKGPIEILHLAAESKRTHRENERSTALDNFGDAAMKEEHHYTMMLRYHEQVIKYLIRYVTAVLPGDASDEQKKEYDVEKTLHMQKATNAMHHAFHHQLAGSKFRKDTEQHRAIVVQCEQEMREVETELNRETWKLINEALCGREEGIDSEIASFVKTVKGPQKGNGSQHGNGSQSRNGTQSSKGGANRKLSADPSNTQKNGNGKTKNTSVSDGDKLHSNTGNRDENGNANSDGNGGQIGKGYTRKWKKNHKKTPSATTDASKTTVVSKAERKIEQKIEPTPAEAAKLGNGKVDRGNVNKTDNDSQNSHKSVTTAGPQNGNKASSTGATLDNAADSQNTSEADSTNGSQVETFSKKKMGSNAPNNNNQNYKNKNHKSAASATADASKTDEPKIDMKKLERPKTAAPKAAAKIEDGGAKMKMIDPDSYARLA